MDIKNTSKRTLRFSTGETVKSGESVTFDKFDKEHHVTKAWIDAGLIEVAETKTTKSKSTAKTDS